MASRWASPNASASKICVTKSGWIRDPFTGIGQVSAETQFQADKLQFINIEDASLVVFIIVCPKGRNVLPVGMGFTALPARLPTIKLFPTNNDEEFVLNDYPVVVCYHEAGNM
jgi:hypothetical protein